MVTYLIIYLSKQYVWVFLIIVGVKLVLISKEIRSNEKRANQHWFFGVPYTFPHILSGFFNFHLTFHINNKISNWYVKKKSIYEGR